MKDAPITPGRVVRSCAGRDGGRLFVVVAMLDEAYVAIADGKLRKMDRPKRKKRKHLKVTHWVIEGLQEKLQAGAPVQDHELRKALKSLAPEEEG